MSKYLDIEENNKWWEGLDTKEDFADKYGSLVTESNMKVEPEVWSEQPKDKVLVVWGRPSFEVLAIVENLSDFDFFNQDDYINKKWVYMDLDYIMELCPEYKRGKK